MRPDPLFRRLIGPAFDDLPAAMRAIHAGSAMRLRGRCEVARGDGFLSRICGAVARLPPAGSDVPISFAIDVDDAGRETWTRDFGGHLFRSTLEARQGELFERIGPTTYRYRLVPTADAVQWELLAMHVLGIPLPAFARAVVHAREGTNDGRYTFDVRAEMPAIGLLVHYRGWLEPA